MFQHILDFEKHWKGYNFVIIRNLLVNILIKALVVSLSERFHRIDYYWLVTIIAHACIYDTASPFVEKYVLQAKYNIKIFNNTVNWVKTHLKWALTIMPEFTFLMYSL